jgi:LacI family transcriptional regulator
MKKTSAVTLVDVARAAQISRTAASDILRGADGRFPRETQQRVRQAARRLGYRPHTAARLLRQNTKTLVGLALSVRQYAQLNELAVAAHGALKKRGFEPVLIEPWRLVTGDNADLISSKMLAGLISIDLSMSEEIPAFYQTLRRQLPVVAMYPCRPRLVPVVTTDFAALASLCVEHLLSLGHRHIAFAGSFDSELEIDRLKIAGWRRAVRQFDLQVLPGYEISVITGDLAGANIGGEQVCRAWEQLRPRPTALVSHNDWLALNVMMRLAQKSYQLPRDLSITGFSGEEVGVMTVPPLTTPTWPIDEIGVAAVERLAQMIESGDYDPDAHHEPQYIAPGWLERASTAPPLMNSYANLQPRVLQEVS